MNEYVYIYINQYKDNIKSSKSALIMYGNQLLDFPRERWNHNTSNFNHNGRRYK